MPALRRGRLRLAVLVCAGAACMSPAVGSAEASALPDVERAGSELVEGGQRFRVYGFNYGLRERYPILSYFDGPTESRLRRVVADIRRARKLGANTLRIYLELGAFMNGPKQPRRQALAALAALLEEAERLRVHLDLTGNLVWRDPPGWYDALPEQARWAVQARFWRAVARTAQSSPAVLVYELTSEPVVAEADDWYCGDIDGYTFIQRIVKDPSGRDPSRLARRWIRRLTGAIRAHDRRHLIGIGLLPFGGPFGPANVADLLDLLLVHQYPAAGKEREAVALVREFAAQGKPVVLGETAPLLTTRERWGSFLTATRRFVDGHLFFYDGRIPREAGTAGADAWYAAALRQFLGLRPALEPAGPIST